MPDAQVINIHVSNRIFIQTPEGALSQEQQQFLAIIKDENRIPNPAYDEAVKHGRYTGNILKTIVLARIEKTGRDEKTGISLPRGYAGRLLQLAKHFGVEHQFKDCRVQLLRVAFRSNIQLRGYQQPAVEAMLKGTQGILEAPAGSGKTLIGMEIVARVGQPALWITHTKDLAEQAIQRAQQYLGVARNEIGLFGDGKQLIGEKLTVALVQTLIGMSVERFDDLARYFGLAILDECHHCPANTFSEVMDRLPARWKYGLTATKSRADELTVLIDRYIGPTLYRIDRSAVEASGGVIVPELRVIRTDTVSETYEKHTERMARWKEICADRKNSDLPTPREPMLNYAGVLNDVLFNVDRNQLIVNTLMRECPGHCSLVLSERVDHIQALAELLGQYAALKCAVIHGKLPIRKRDEIIQAMKDGGLDILFAVDIAREGLDIPRLDRLFIVGGGRNEAEIEQKVGRIQRAHPGKRDCIVFDVVDEKVGVLRAQYWVRRKVYKRLGMIGSGMIGSGEARQVG